MRSDEVDWLLERLVAAFPTARMEEGTPDEWARVLRPMREEDGAAAVDRWIATEPRFPAIAQFVAMVRVESNRSTERQLPAAPPPPPTPPEVAFDRIAGIRETLGRAKPTPDLDAEEPTP